MHLVALGAEHFRNLATFRLTPHRRFNILEGKNGQGKTNLLEAVFLLSAFRSFRDARNRELVSWSEEAATVYGEIVRRDIARTVQVTVSGKGKRVALDGKNITRLPDELAHLNVVLFGPDDLSLTKAGPQLRRRFIDRAAYAVWPDYVTGLRRYAEALKNRNELLRQAASGGLDAGVIQAFEHALVQHGARVIQRRLQFLKSFQPHFDRVFDHITAGALKGGIAYRGFKGLTKDADLAALEAGYAEALDEARATDMRRGFTSVGPHSDDLLFHINKRSARVYASQGQHRAFVLALKIAELHRIHEAIGVYPVFLLDDVSSELDEERNAQLMTYLDQAGGQVFITTTDRRFIHVASDARVYRVADGVISAE